MYKYESWDQANPTKQSLTLWGVLLGIWFLVLCFVPDPRPLSAPEWAVKLVQGVSGASMPVARLIATLLLRGIGFGLLGLLCSAFILNWKSKRLVFVALIVGPLLAIVSQWVNYGHFPIFQQIAVAIVATVSGVLIGSSFRGNKLALPALLVFLVGLFVWGTSTGISDDLYELAKATANHVVANGDKIPEGDEGFIELLEMAFAYAEDNSHRTDAVKPGKAAILALGVIVGEEKIAVVANRPVDLKDNQAVQSIRRRVTLHGRNDLARHFWVSAALAVLSDQERTMTVGITKELMDATPGGSGFSFADLAADAAGTRFAVAATRDSSSARKMYDRLRAGVTVADLCPEPEGLPEGITRTEFQKIYGGLGGVKTTQIVDEILARMAKCSALDFRVNQ